MSNVQFPHIVFTTELNTLAEYLLHLLVVPAVPVYLSLSHQYWNIAGGEVMCQLSNPLSLPHHSKVLIIVLHCLFHSSHVMTQLQLDSTLPQEL